jgi:proton-dependent oligopeptide transporter, POT family
MSDQEAERFVKPNQQSKMPPGIPYIVGNEAAERFSFYGMKAILFVYMTKYLVNAAGQPDPMTPEDSRAAVHWFVASAYFFPVAGAILSDWLLGKYRTIFWLSLVYCVGHLALATIAGRWGLLAGLSLIAIGAGGIKPCVSAHVGDQFTEQNKHLLPNVFSWFYFSINFGSFFSTIITPILLDRFGPHWGPHFAFGLPGLLMCLATFVFWLGRNKFVHVKPGGTAFIRETFSLDGLRAITRLVPLFLFVAIFWALYDQTASAWVEQAESMNRNWLGIEWLSSQIQAINPLLVLVLIPVCAYGLYPALNSLFPLTALRKVAIGFVLTVLAFATSGWIESQITGGKLIRNGVVESKKDVGSISTGESETAASKKQREIILRLREHRSWNIKSIGWSLSESKSSTPTSEKPVRLSVRVETGSTPTGPWTEQVTDDFESKLIEQHVIELPKVISAGYVRLIIGKVHVSGDAETDDQINWNEPHIVVNAAESSPPADAHAHAAQVWPDVAATGYKPSIFWQFVSYLILTLAEVLVSITFLEFSYTQAPNKLKSLIMSLFLLSVSLGNAITALVNKFIQNTDGTSKLPGASYYWFFTGLMAVATVGFLFVSATYREKSYLQSNADVE